ncbi:hypothetical protein FNV43_RR03377 [Rhamnella rubrinervis]|uniref:Uncharacterized protein n=1 Tax=Rhamnella rubrinervis TaxID=2594499 RepID=A0A8K0MP12_9ROSA|nr:hypothetical protein FNV43_RR03377 [Rhamnella rubrinervis]
MMILVLAMAFEASCRDLNGAQAVTTSSADSEQFHGVAGGVGVTKTTTPGFFLTMSFPLGQVPCGYPCSYFTPCGGGCTCMPGPVGICV